MHFIYEGQATVTDGGRRSAGHLAAFTKHEGNEEENDPLEAFRGERELAAAVFRQAFLDLGVRVDGQRGRRGDSAEHEHDRSTARLFLFDPAWAPMREHWLALLGLTDEDWTILIHKETHQGHRNRVLEALELARPDAVRYSMAASMVANARRQLVHPALLGTGTPGRCTATETDSGARANGDQYGVISVGMASCA